MQGLTWTPRVSSRTASPTSNVACFQVDVLQGSNYCAFATSDGCIVIQQAIHPPSDDSCSTPVLLMQHSSGAAADAAPPAQGQFVTVAVLDHQQDGSTPRHREVYRWVAWGGGPAYLLCAASETRVDFFCLRHFFLQHAGQFAEASNEAARLLTAPRTLQQGDTPSVPLPLVMWPHLGSHRLPHALIAMDWSQNSTGLLLSDDANNVTMLNMDINGVDSVHVAQGGMPELAVSVAWSACSDSPQPLAAAGWSPGTPSATASSKLTPGATNPQHRVLIWWPRPPEAPKPAPAPTPVPPPPTKALGPPRGPQAGKGSNPQARPKQAATVSTPAPAAATGPLVYNVGNEVIRHPVKVLDMQWSPPLWQKSMSRSNSTNNLADLQHAAGAASRPATHSSPGTVASRAPVGTMPQPAVSPGSTQSTADKPPQLALMTVGADWVVRIWVEVLMKDLLPAHLTAAATDPVAAAAAAAALSMSQFCLALVIDPPTPGPAPPPATGLNAGACVGGGLRAAWARPMPRAVLALPKHGRDEVLGGHDAVDIYHESGQLAKSGSGTALPYGMSRAAVQIASRVQWLVACVGAPAAQTAGQGHGGGTELEETIYVWALDGLQADGVLAQQQQPRGGMAAGRAGSGPRAVLWGRESRHIHWVQRHHMTHRKDIRQHSSAYVIYPKGMPVFHCLEWWKSPVEQVAEARAVVVDAVTQDVGHTACPHTGIALESVSHGLLTGVRSSVRGLTPHPVQHNLAASLYKDGRVGFWWLDPVEELPLTTRRTSSRHLHTLQYIPPACSDAFLDPCAMTGMFGPVSAIAWMQLPQPPSAPQQQPPATQQASSMSSSSAFASGKAQALTSVRIHPNLDSASATATLGPVSYLACAVAGTVYIYSLQLPDYSSLIPSYSPASSWGVLVVAEVLRLQLPGSWSHVTHILQTGPLSLTALAAEPPPDQLKRQSQRSELTDLEGPDESVHGDAHLAALGARAWVSWQIQPPAPSAPGVSPTAASTHFSASEPSLLMAEDLLHPAADSRHTGHHQQPSSVHGVLTCIDVPVGQYISCVTGSSSGAVHLWSLSASGAPQLSFTCWCEVPTGDTFPTGVPGGLPYPATAQQVEARMSDPGVSAAGSGEDTKGLYHCLPVGVAMQETVGLVAAVATCGPAEAEDVLFVWRAATVATKAAQSSSTNVAQSCSLQDRWELDDVVVLRDTAYCVTWLPTAHSMAALLAVGYVSGVVEYFAPGRTVGWHVVARYQVGDDGDGVTALLGMPGGGCALSAGTSVQVLSSQLWCLPPSLPVGQQQAPSAAPSSVAMAKSYRGLRAATGSELPLVGSSRTVGPLISALGTPVLGTSVLPQPVMCSVGELLQEVGGPRAWYHPATLETLVRCGHAATACRLLRRLIQWLQSSATVLIAHDETQLIASMPMSASSLNAAGYPLASPFSNSDILGSSGSAAAAPPQLPPLPAVSLDELLLDTRLAGTAEMQALQRLHELPAAGGTSTQLGSAAATGSSSTSQPASASAPAFNHAGSITFRHGSNASSDGHTSGPSISAAPPAPAATSALDTGMLNMAAFGSFGDFSGMDQPADEASTQPATTTDASVSKPAATDASLLTGMLDMSAFGMDTTPEEPPAPQTPQVQASKPAAAQDTGQLDMSMMSGMLDMGAFGMDYTPEPPAPPPPPTPPVDTKPAASPATSGVHDPDLPLAVLKEMKKAAAAAAAIAAQATQTSTAAGATGVSANGAVATGGAMAGTTGADLVVFPRALPGAVTVSAANTEEDLQRVLLSKEEVATLQSLLQVDLTQSGVGGGQANGAASAETAQPALPSYLQEDDGSAAVDSRAAQLQEALRLGPQQVTHLVVLARTLVNTSPTDLALACGASQGLGAVLGAAPLQPDMELATGRKTPNLGTDVDSTLDIKDTNKNAGDIIEGLDSAARQYLVALRLAAAAEVLGPVFGDEEAEAEDEDGAGARDKSGPSGRLSSASQGRLDSSVANPAPSYKQLFKRPATTSPDTKVSGILSSGSNSPQLPLASRLKSSGISTRKTSGLTFSSKPSVSMMLSFSSAGALAVAGTPAGQTGGSPRTTWWRRMGLLRRLDMRAVLQAAASGCQGALLSAALPHVAWMPAQETLAAPDAGSGRAGFTSSASRTGRPDIAWPLLHKMGVGLWLLDPPTLAAKVEELAKAQFARHKDPYECALLYLALGKKAMLLNLFRQASNMKLVEFLSRDFTNNEAARLAAAKNAYVLLGQHKYDLAAAFFLLAGSPKEAVGVLAHERADPQMALIVARLVEGGPGGPIASRVIQEDLMPLARKCPDAAALPCLLWADGRSSEAVQTLALAYGPLPGPLPLACGGPGVLETAYARRCNDPGVLHATLTLGLKQLVGKPVNRHLAAGMASLALRCAAGCESLGVATLALESLLTALILLHPTAQGDLSVHSYITQGASPHVIKRHARLLAASLVQLHATAALPAPPAGIGHPADSPRSHTFTSAIPPAGTSLSLEQVQQAAEAVGRCEAQLLSAAVAPALKPAVSQVLALTNEQLKCQEPGQGLQHGLLVPMSLRCSSTPPPPTPQSRASPIGPRPPTPSSQSHAGGLHQQHGAHFEQHSPVHAVGHHPQQHLHGGHSHPQLPQLTTRRSGGGAGPHTAITIHPSSHANTPRSQIATTPVSRAGSTVSLSGGVTHQHHSTGSLRHVSSGGTGHLHHVGSASRVSLDKTDNWTLAPKGGILADAWEVLSVDGDKVMAVACCSARGALNMGRGPTDSRPLVAAMSKAGLVGAEVELPINQQALAASAAERSSLWARQGSLFMGLLGQVLEHVRWTPDPWAAVASQVHGSGTAQGGAGGSGSSNQSPRGGGSQWPSFTRLSSTVHLTAQTTSTHTNTLAAHPTKELYVSGSSGDHVFLWAYNDPASHHAYVPLIEPNAAALSRAQGPAQENSTAVALAYAAPQRKQLLLQLLQSPHWDGAACLRYTRDGSRFAGIGAGGLVSLWRQDLPPGAGGVGYADWLQHCVGKRGVDLLFTDEAGKQFLVCGKGDKGGVVSWWDTQSPATSSCIAELRGRKAMPTCMQLMTHVSSGHLLVVGDEAGEVSGLDLRMLGTQLPLWILPKAHGAHGGGCTTMATWTADTDPTGLTINRPPTHLTALATTLSHRASGELSGGSSRSTSIHGGTAPAQSGALKLRSLLAVGGKEGSMVFLDATTGHCVQAIERVHWQLKRNPLVGLLHGNERPAHHPGSRGVPPNSVGVAVNGIVCCEGGLLSCGMDGVVRFHPLSALSATSQF